MSVTAAEGFVAAGCHAGIKRRKFDMAMIAADDRRPVACAAVFTQNKFAAPPVELGRWDQPADSQGRANEDHSTCPSAPRSAAIRPVRARSKARSRDRARWRGPQAC